MTLDLWNTTSLNKFYTHRRMHIIPRADVPLLQSDPRSMEYHYTHMQNTHILRADVPLPIDHRCMEYLLPQMKFNI